MTDISRAQDKVSAGDPIPPKCAVIEVHIGELKQLFDAIDPSPFRDRDLDPKAEEFIVGWAKDLPRDASLALVVDLDQRQAYLTKLLFCGTRSTSFSGIALKHIANGSGIVPCGSDQPGDRFSRFSWRDCIRRFSRRFDEGQPSRADRARKPDHRGLGFYVASPGSLLVRLVADSQ